MRAITRRKFVGAGAIAAATLAVSGCTGKDAGFEPSQPNPEGAVASPSAPDASKEDAQAPTLPSSDPDPENPFQVDRGVNMDTIDQYLNLPGVAYRDMRMVFDPADYGAIGGSPNLDIVLPGFAVVPFPYIATLPELPVEGAYIGPHLFDAEWSEDGTVASAVPLYEQSRQIIDELFPKDAPIVLMCGGGGYAGQMRQLLIFLGWDAGKLYNAGGAWDYTGYESIQIIDYAANGTPRSYLWRATIVPLEFDTFSIAR